MRLAKYLAKAGVSSRRRAESMIREGMVKVNGLVVEQPQVKVEAGDSVTVNGKLVKCFEKKHYILLNKPPGYISTVHDTHRRPTVMSMVEDVDARLYPVGRLDADTSGVLLMTNDGELAYRLTHPSFQVKKIYHARVKGLPNRKKLKQLSEGVNIGGERSARASVRLLNVSVENNTALLEITLSEGRKRQVKKMCEAINHPVLKLHRERFAGLSSGDLLEGSYRVLTEKEIKNLYRLVGL